MSTSNGCAMNVVPATTPAGWVPLGPSCNGCRHCGYAARYGQASNPLAHARCLALDVDVPMVLDARDEWRSSVLPPGCPEHSQGALFA